MKEEGPQQKVGLAGRDHRMSAAGEIKTKPSLMVGGHQSTSRHDNRASFIRSQWKGVSLAGSPPSKVTALSQPPSGECHFQMDRRHLETHAEGPADNTAHVACKTHRKHLKHLFPDLQIQITFGSFVLKD